MPSYEGDSKSPDFDQGVPSFRPGATHREQIWGAFPRSFQAFVGYGYQSTVVAWLPFCWSLSIRISSGDGSAGIIQLLMAVGNANKAVARPWAHIPLLSLLVREIIT